jgi:hypothetical protein
MVVRRWGFWYEGKLAIVGVVNRIRPGKVWVRFNELSSYLLSTPLPKRLDFENRVKREVQRDIHRAMGPDWDLISRFEGKLGEGPEAFGKLSHHHPNHG